MNPNYFIVYDGDHGPLHEIGVDDKDGAEVGLTGFTCRVYVPETSLDREVTDTDGNDFQVQLTPAETEALQPGIHSVGITVENPNVVPVPYKQHETYKIEIKSRVE